MKLTVSYLLMTMTVCSVHGDDATLYWNNGDSLTGSLHHGTDSTLTWQSELFNDPLTIELAALAAVRFQYQTPPQSSDDPFRITMQNGDVLTGNPTSVDKSFFRFQSTRHGPLTLHRHQIQNLRRINSKGQFFLGPRGIDEWAAATTDGNPEYWRDEPGGKFSTSKSEASLFRPFDFPDQCEIEIEIESSTRPSFLLGLGQKENDFIRLETWEDSLVVLSGLDFVEVQTIPDTQHSVHVHLFVDFINERIAVFSGTLEKLAEIEVKTGKESTHGILIRNGEGDLTVNHLRIAQWDGKVPEKLKPGQSSVHMTDGSVQYGEIGGLDQRNNTVTFLNSDTQIPVDDIVGVFVTAQRKFDKDKSPAPVQVSWSDGSFLSGSLATASGERIDLITEYSDTPVSSATDGILRIGLPHAAESTTEPDRLFFSGGSLQGNLIIEDSGDRPLQWKPIGGLNATSLAAGDGNARYLRGDISGTSGIDVDRFPDVIYLTNSDIIPCRLKSGTDKQLNITTPFAEISQLSTTIVKAVELSTTHRVQQKGFADGNWEGITGPLTRTDDMLAFRNTASIGHPSIVNGDTVQFRLQWQPSGVIGLTASFFPESLRQLAGATVIRFTMQGNQIRVNSEIEEVLFGGGFGPVPEKKATDIIKVKNQTADVSVVLNAGELHVAINEQPVTSIPINPEGSGGSGLVLQASVSGANAAAGGFQGRLVSTIGRLEVSQFEVRNISGALIRQFIDAEALQRTLTVPRFRREDPPTHVLLAPNGDLLRGRLVRATDQIIEFESRLETFRFERERVAAVIWLGQQDPQSTSGAVSADSDSTTTSTADASAVTTKATTSDSTQTHPNGTEIQALLQGGYVITMTPAKSVKGHLVGSSVSLGDCSIPGSAIRELFVGRPEGRHTVLAYSEWVTQGAQEPDWGIPEDGQSNAPGTELIGQIAPPFELRLLNGESFRLTDHTEKVIVLDFWATWCGPCVMALPEYIEATADFDSASVVFVAVNLEESAQRVSEFLEQRNLSPTVALDGGSNVARQFHVSGIPHSVIIGPGNVVEYVHVGYRRGAGLEVRDTIERILAGTWERAAASSE